MDPNNAMRAAPEDEIEEQLEPGDPLFGFVLAHSIWLSRVILGAAYPL